MRKLFILITVTLWCLSDVSQAQVPSFEEFRRQQEQAFNAFVAARDSVLDAMNQDFENYVEQRNREYAEYLKNEWIRMQVFLGEMPEPGPKPDEFPAYDPVEEDEQVREERKERVERVFSTLTPADAEVQPLEQFREPVTLRPVERITYAMPTVSIDFYGRSLTIETDRSFRGLRSYGIQEDEVARWFENAAGTNFTPTLIHLLDLADETGMNDWALFMAAGKLSQNLAGRDEVAATLYTWFLLLQAGYDIRLGRQQGKLVFLMPFAHTVYNTPRLGMDGKTYYIINGVSEEPIYTYQQTMPGAFRVFDMNFYKSPQFAARGKEKTLQFYFNDQEYSIQMQYDPVLVAMLAEQPQADMNIYLDADASNFMVQASEQALEPLLEQMNDVEKVSFLLSLSQNAFKYQTDIDQFGYQKYMTPDEVIHYSYSDCDDRAVLFGWLVRNFAGQKVAALLYPGHLANAVHFYNGNPEGDKLIIDGLEFVMADPTYINAPLGLTMPDYINIVPTAWVIDADRYFFEQSLSLWETLYQYGARRGNNQRDVALGPNGEYFVTGYFTSQFETPGGAIRFSGEEDQRTAFVAAFSNNMQPLWAHAFASEEDATGFSMLIDRRQNIVLAGSFTGKIGLQGRELVSESTHPDVFVASLRPSGTVSWIANGGLENRHYNNAMAYSLHIGLDGKNSSLHYYNDPRESINGLFADGDHSVVLTGTFGNTSGLTMDHAPQLASAAAMNYTELLIQKNKELINNRVESSIAGLIAAIHISKSEGVVFPGSAAQEALRKANPRFMREFPTAFANIGKISFLRNKSGIIEIRTENGEDVFFDKMRIRNGSTVRIRSLPNGDEQIDILSNIHVGQAVIWYPLNFIRLYHRTGDLLFDYRRNNSQVTLNLKKDILD